jgi:hypothetical protein
MLGGKLTRRSALGRSAAFRDAPEHVEVASDCAARRRVRHGHHRHGPVVATPTWAKLIDFEATLPTAVEELVQQQEQRGSSGRRGS